MPSFVDLRGLGGYRFRELRRYHRFAPRMLYRCYHNQTHPLFAADEPYTFRNRCAFDAAFSSP
jgi:hypothetical protein